MSGNAAILLLIFVIAFIDWLRTKLKSGGGKSPQAVMVVSPPKASLGKRLRKQGREIIVGGGLLWLVVAGLSHASHSHH